MFDGPYSAESLRLRLVEKRPLTPDEKKALEERIQNCRRDRLFFAVAAVASGILMYFYTFPLTLFERVLATVLVAGFMAVLAGICHLGLLRMKADLTEGMLEIIEGRITWKARGSGAYSAQVGNIPAFIPSIELARIAVGDKVHLERACVSRTVLKVSRVSTAEGTGESK